jgi:S1-C subfamily serine protease
MPLLKTGGFASTDAAGSVGTGVLKRFRATFDYSRKHLYLTPGTNYAVADPADRSGLWLSSDETGFKVMSVAAGSPAAEAGLHVDDVVVAVDGKPATQIFLVELRERLKTASPGTQVRLTVKTATNTRDVTITLRDLI